MPAVFFDCKSVLHRETFDCLRKIDRQILMRGRAMNLLNTRSVLARIDRRSREWLRLAVKAGKFPPPIPGANGEPNFWTSDDVDHWIQAQADKRAQRAPSRQPDMQQSHTEAQR